MFAKEVRQELDRRGVQYSDDDKAPELKALLAKEMKGMFDGWEILYDNYILVEPTVFLVTIGHSHNATFHGDFQKYSVKQYALSLTECVWDFHKNALWDTH